jgi:hypothetical protein
MGLSFYEAPTFTGIARFSIYINNQLVLKIGALEAAAMESNVNSILGGSYTDILSSFWHIFPIDFTSRGGYKNDMITVLFDNITDSDNFTFGLEIYNNTNAQLTSATNVSQLNIANSFALNNYYLVS